MALRETVLDVCEIIIDIFFYKNINDTYKIRTLCAYLQVTSKHKEPLRANWKPMYSRPEAQTVVTLSTSLLLYYEVEIRSQEG